MFLVAIVVEGQQRANAELTLHDGLKILTGGHVSEWWVAEDDRRDGSDNDSAVFVPKGEQQAWTDVITATSRDTKCQRRRWFRSAKGGRR